MKVDRRIFLTVVCVFVLSAGRMAWGSELGDLIGKALQQNHELNAVRYYTSSLGEEYKASMGRFFPHIWFQEEGFRSNDPPFVWMTKMSRKDVVPEMMNLKGFNDPDAVTHFKSSFKLLLPLFHGGEIYSTVMMNKAFYKSAREWLESSKEEIALAVAQSYLETTWAKSRVEAAHSAVKGAEHHVEQAQDRYRSGMALKADILKAEVYLASMKDHLAKEETALDIVRRRLTLLVGGDPMAPVDVKADLGALYTSYKDFEATLEQLISLALERRRDYIAQKNRIEASRYGVRRALSDYFPKVDISAAWEWHGHNFPGDSDASDWMVGGVAKLNIFDGFTREHKLKKAKALMAREEQKTLLKRKEVMLEVISGLLRVREGKKRVEASSASVDEAIEALRVMEKRYDVGLATMVELTDAQTALVDARSLYIGALHDYLKAIYSLQYATGTLLEFVGVGSFSSKEEG